MATVDFGVFLIVLLVLLLIVLPFAGKLLVFFSMHAPRLRQLHADFSNASDEDTRRRLQREIRREYLCLLPFVTKRNLNPIYHKLYDRPLPQKKDTALRVFTTPLLAILICLTCLSGLTFAWFTANTAQPTQSIRTASFALSATVQYQNAGMTETLTPSAGKFALTAKTTYTISLSTTGSTASRGYGVLTLTAAGGSSSMLYTQTIAQDATFSFTYVPDQDYTLQVEGNWGALPEALSASAIANGSTLNVGLRASAALAAHQTHLAAATNEEPSSGTQQSVSSTQPELQTTLEEGSTAQTEELTEATQPQLTSTASSEPSLDTSAEPETTAAESDTLPEETVAAIEESTTAATPAAATSPEDTTIAEESSAVSVPVP